MTHNPFQRHGSHRWSKWRRYTEYYGIWNILNREEKNPPLLLLHYFSPPPPPLPLQRSKIKLLTHSKNQYIHQADLLSTTMASTSYTINWWRVVEPEGFRPGDWTALHLAAFQGRHDVVKDLIGQRIDMEAPINDGATALHLAASRGHLRVVQILLAEGAVVGPKNRRGRTPLHHAAEGGHSEIVQTLLESGAAPDARDRNGATPLFIAVQESVGEEDIGKFLAVVRVLLSRGADKEAADKDGRTASDISFEYEMLKVLEGKWN